MKELRSTRALRMVQHTMLDPDKTFSKIILEFMDKVKEASCYAPSTLCEYAHKRI